MVSTKGFILFYQCEFLAVVILYGWEGLGDRIEGSHDELDLISLDCCSHGQSDARVAGGSLNQSVARLNNSLPLRLHYHAHSRSTTQIPV